MSDFWDPGQFWNYEAFVGVIASQKKGGRPNAEVLTPRQPSEGAEIIFRKSKFESVVNLKEARVKH